MDNKVNLLETKVNKLNYLDNSIININNFTIIGMATVGNDSWVSIAYGNGKYVVVGSGGNFTYSTDGINWATPSYISGSTNQWSEICYANGKFVAVDYSGNVSTSTNGTSWTTPVKTDISNAGVIKYLKDKFYIFGIGTFIYSEDGISWSSSTKMFSSSGVSTIKDAAYGNNVFIAVYNTRGSSISYTAVSTDGIKWNTSDYRITNISSVSRVEFVNGKFIAVGTSKSNSGICTTTDGKNWTILKNTAEYSWLTIFSKGEKVVIAGYKDFSDLFGYYIQSNDYGNTWSDFKKMNQPRSSDGIFM